MEQDFEFDVAFSFCAQDEGVVLRINSLLKERLKTFVFSEQQKSIAGRDGELKFSEVFLKKSRIVVILYRSIWGTTSWTRIEMEAIRNRAHDNGYDFTVLIPMEKGVAVPPWYPKHFLWVGLDRYGVEGAASVIESKVTERGGEIHEVTAESKARELAEKFAFEEERRKILENGNIIPISDEYYSQLVVEIESLLAKINTETGRFHAAREDYHLNRIFVIGKISLHLNWHRTFSNSLSGSGLEVLFWSGRKTFKHAYYFEGGEPSRVETEALAFDVNGSMEYGWTSTRSKKFYNNKILAEKIISRLVDLIGKS